MSKKASFFCGYEIFFIKINLNMPIFEVSNCILAFKTKCTAQKKSQKKD